MQFPVPQKNLLRMLSDGQCHSGAYLARALQVSRTAVWAQVHDLQGLGLQVNALSGKGYRLQQALELLEESQIRAALDVQVSDLVTLELHDLLDSTNTQLNERARQGAAPGTVCIAELQTAGRGRLGRAWHSPFAGNFCLSVLWHYPDHQAIAGLSLAVGVAIVRALKQVGIEDVGLKWPNDVLWQGRKLGGILMEVTGEIHGKHAVIVGIGLNRHIPAARAESIDQAWVDLEQITGGKTPSRNRLMAGLLNQLVPLLQTYADLGLAAYLDEWRRYHVFDGRNVVLRQGERTIRGVVTGVSAAGLLRLDCEGEGVREFSSGDVSLRPDHA